MSSTCIAPPPPQRGARARGRMPQGLQAGGAQQQPSLFDRGIPCREKAERPPHCTSKVSFCARACVCTLQSVCRSLLQHPSSRPHAKPHHIAGGVGGCLHTYGAQRERGSSGLALIVEQHSSASCVRERITLGCLSACTPHPSHMSVNLVCIGRMWRLPAALMRAGTHQKGIAARCFDPPRDSQGWEGQGELVWVAGNVRGHMLSPPFFFLCCCCKCCA